VVAECTNWPIRGGDGGLRRRSLVCETDEYIAANASFPQSRLLLEGTPLTPLGEIPEIILNGSLNGTDTDWPESPTLNDSLALTDPKWFRGGRFRL